MPGGRSGDKELGMDVTINDAPPDTRHFLTRRPTQARGALFAVLQPPLQSGRHEQGGSMHGLCLRTREASELLGHIACKSTRGERGPLAPLRPARCPPRAARAGAAQDDIGRRTGTVLTVRGRYYPPGVPRDERDPPLLLHIAPGASHVEARARPGLPRWPAMHAAQDPLGGCSPPRPPPAARRRVRNRPGDASYAFLLVKRCGAHLGSQQEARAGAGLGAAPGARSSGLLCGAWSAWRGACAAVTWPARGGLHQGAQACALAQRVCALCPPQAQRRCLPAWSAP